MQINIIVLMFGILISLVGNAIALLVVTYFVPGVTVENYTTLFLAAISIGIVNAIIKPILRLISLPITLVTFGLFALVVNAVCFLIAAWFVPGFEIDGFITAILGAIVMSIASIVINFFTDKIGGGKSIKEPPPTEQAST